MLRLMLVLLVLGTTVSCSDDGGSTEGDLGQGTGGDSNSGEDSDSSENRCETSSASVDGSDCQFSFSDCADGREYTVECDITECTCQVNGTTTQTFTHANDCQNMLADGGDLVVQVCQFDIAFDSVRPDIESCGEGPNELGIGQLCVGSSDCTGHTICIGTAGTGEVNMCTIQCEESSECGSGASCLEISGLSLCLPPSCEHLI